MQFSKVAQCAVIFFICSHLYAQTRDPGQTSSPSNASPMGASNVDDKQLAKDVRSALRRGKRSGFSFSNIRVRVKGGVVSLTGAVPAQTDVDAATKVTQTVPGVTAVDNRMTVHVPMNRYGGQ